MANTTDTVNVSFGADVKGLTSGLAEVSKSIESTVENSKRGLAGLADALTAAFKSPVVIAGAAFAGLAAAIGHGISKTADLTREIFNFSSVMGISTEQAGALKQALEEIGLSTDTYSDAFLKFTRQVKNSGSDLEKNFGLKLRDTNGHLRDGNVIFQEALAKVFEYKAGIDQDTVAMALFGKSVKDVILLQRLNAQATEEAKEKNKALGLNITDNNIAAYKAWQKASNDVKDVFEALWKVVGDAFLPILTELGEWFSDIGPTAVKITRIAIAGLATAFYSIEDVAVAIVAPIQAALNSIKSAAVNTAKAIINVASLNFSEAKNNIKQIATDAENAFGKAGSKISAQLTKSKNAVNEILHPDQTTSKPKGGTKSAPNLEKSAGTERSRKSEALRMAEEEVRHQEAMQNELLDQKKAIAESELNLGLITKQQLIQQEIGFENQKYNIEKAAVEKRLQIAQNDPSQSPAARQKVLDQLLELQQKHETAVLKLKLQAAEEAQKFNIQASQTIQDSFQSLFESVISGQKNLSDAFNDFVNSIVSALSKLAAQYLAQAVFGGGGGLTSMVGSLFGGGGGGLFGGGGIGSLFGSFFGGARAGGGDVQAGMAYMVGEKGAEMFVPKVSGTIVPNGGGGGGKSVSVVNQFTIQGTMSQQSQQQIAAMVGIAVNSAVRRNN